MKSLLLVARLISENERQAFLRGLILSILVLIMGAALLGLSGWFVTAAAAAGIGGIGIAFDFFRPSAGVRFLALGRAAARYGERMLSHDATLRALARLRGAVHSGITRLPHEVQARLRGAEALNRLTADIDALDGLMLRLVLPFFAACATQAVAFVALWFLVTPATAIAVMAIYSLGGISILTLAALRAHAPATAAEASLQQIRAQSLDLMRNRADLAVAGALERQTDAALEAVRAEEAARQRLDDIDLWSGAALALTAGLAATAAIFLGGRAAEAGIISPAESAIGFFVALALAETLTTLRRGLAEWGRMQGAAGRVLALVDTPARATTQTAPAPRSGAPVLEAKALVHRRPGAERASFGPLSFTLAAGETLLVTGPSGAGKSTLLATLSGLIAPSSGEILLSGAPLGDWSEARLRERLTLVPQRSALIGGTIAENLALALPEERAQDEDRMWQALEAVHLAGVLHAREGLQTLLGPQGSGLSGGQAKRLALARAALRRPQVLMLDEPTEGLDAATAHGTLLGLRQLLPEAGIIFVSHRAPDAAMADRVLTITV
ncbi:ATP-binding cassette subfamily C protein CydC [Rhodobacter aestuarii]|uniref:ATP-binding cassette, subfamily C, CydC n=1 Tax=Rhodobacter aestuarii TaxID=453582 RepID=A0A1N7QD73_9RHOB|nr:thiol reductant ABC exporter subunit CydC [Rhodobacter aestuarii]PTV93579.1 ATP-binding cassette subfamily C protein CydC [Rhodobacter aestuarii]SIT20823.1 ATP-binding cassette, subfamily C, CydC [Rhodobacter aestuarii]